MRSQSARRSLFVTRLLVGVVRLPDYAANVEGASSAGAWSSSPAVVPAPQSPGGGAPHHRRGGDSDGGCRGGASGAGGGTGLRQGTGFGRSNRAGGGRSPGGWWDGARVRPDGYDSPVSSRSSASSCTDYGGVTVVSGMRCREHSRREPQDPTLSTCRYVF